MEVIFDGLIRDPGKEDLSGFPDDIVRLRAVQDLLPSQALAFLFSLKGIIREELRAEIAGQDLSDALLSLESRIDSLALSAFDIFMQCREKIYEIRANELKRANFRHLQRADVMNAAHVHKTAPEGKNNLEMKEER
jgi:hypothetical protein